MKSKPWTKDDVKCMKVLAKRKQSAAYVGRVLGRSRGAVANKAMLLKVRFCAINQPIGVQKRRFRKVKRG